MKKSFLLFLALTLSFTLAACRDDLEDRTNPVLSGVEDVNIFLEEDFDALDGVTATDHDGNDITDSITVNGTVNTSETGEYYLRYRAEDEHGFYTEAARYVTVEVDPDNVGDEIVPNGDFSLGMSFWTTTTGLEGGTGNFEVVDGELQIEVTGVSGGMWEPRLENIGITFEKGVIYEISFDARADAPRAINAQVGELLDGAPWFTNFKPGVSGVVDLTTEMQTFKIQFLMDLETNDNGAMIFEFGTVPGDSGTDNLLTTVYLDNVMITEVDPDDVIDEIPPVISGAGNKTITQGSEFDPLEGVTVNDNIDGEITLTLDHITGEVNTDELGEYTLIYTVSDEAGNETVVERKITVVEADESVEGADYGWRTFLNDWEGTAGNLAVIEGELVLTLDNVNTWENWQIQIIQDAYALGTGDDNDGSIQLEAGKTYKVTFDARASVAGDATLAIGHSVDGWNEYYSETFAVTTSMQTFEFEFTLDETGDYTTLAQFKLEMGMLFAGEDDQQRFFLDNVALEVQDDADEFVDAEQIVNGNFDHQIVIEYHYGWRKFLNDWEGTSGDLGVVNGELVLTVDNISNMTDNWKIQLIQDAYALGTGDDNDGSIQFEAGKTYKVTFDARASVAGDATLAIGHAGGGWTEYFSETFAVTTDMETIEIEFTLDDAGDYTTLAQFKIEMGMLFAGEDAPQSFTLDNVMIEVQDDADEFVDADLIVNGDFTHATLRELAHGWRTFLNDWEGTSGSTIVRDGELILRLESINNMTDNWKIQLIQDAYALGTGEDNDGSIQFVAGETYKVSFDVRASVAGDATLAIGHAGDGWTEYFSETFAVTTDMETIEIEFTLDDAGDYTTLAQFKIEMGMLFAGEDAPQSFTLDNVMIQVQDDDDEFVDADFIVNGDFRGVILE